MNAWEEGETIFADVMEYPVAPLFPNADGSMPERASARLVRWTFDLAGASNTIKREPLDDLAGEFPRFDERRAGLSYRHGWFAGRSRRRAGRRVRLHRPCRPQDGQADDLSVRRRRHSGRAGFRPPLGRRAGRRRVGRRRRLPRRRGPQRFRRLRRRRDRSRADRRREGAPAGSVRLPRELARGLSAGLRRWPKLRPRSQGRCGRSSPSKPVLRPVAPT